MSKFSSVSHEDRLTVIEHLDELRVRIFVALGCFVVAFALCFWQNNLILDLLNEPLPPGAKPVTLSVAEPFLTTLTVSAYAALFLSLPVILYQLYAFVLPAFTPSEKRAALPLLLLIPVLFVGGAVFSYFIVLPAAVDFLQNFNANEFNIQLRARDYYGFAALTLIALGIVFQVPVGILTAVRMGLTTPAQLRRKRGPAYIIIAVIAAILPGTDPITMLIEMIPLIVLFELSIVLASIFGPRKKAEGAGAEA